MSVSFIIGKPGSGKSLVTMQDYILPAIRFGRCVYHNIPGLNVVRIAYYLRFKYKRSDITTGYVQSLLHDYSNESLMLPDVYKEWYGGEGAPSENEAGVYYLNAIPNAPSGSLIVLDEAQKKCYINSKDWAAEKNKKFFEYCSVHRKKKHEVLIITQDDSNVDASVVGIREELIFLLRQDRLGGPFKNRVTLRFFLGHETIRNKPYAQTSISYDPAMYDLYESYSVIDSKKEVRKVRVVFMSKKLLLLLFLGFYAIFRSLPGFINIMQGKGFTHKEQKKAEPFNPVLFLGQFDDYHCGDKIYVLRQGGVIDTVPPRSAPAALCPRFNYIYSENIKPKEAE